ncbi:MAG TPA: epoxyqueuosine reductase [Firmicutes bacterium]|jgi:epoxyqueuosine reductase|nr:epoxyqueuosine reductase [Bacillota bacterium]
MELLEKIRQIGEVHAIDLLGVADITKFKKEIAAIGGALVGDYPRALSIGIVLPHSIVDLLQDRESYENIFQYQTHAYQVINARLDTFGSLISSLIQKNGYRVMPVPAADRIDNDRVCASVSHKLVARLAGFGWIGKNCLLINPDHGPRIRWTTVLTDAPLLENREIMENRCRNCQECVKACPAGAILGRNYIDGEARELRLNVDKCQAYFESLKRLNRLDVCGMCLYACPYGRKSNK